MKELKTKKHSNKPRSSKPFIQRIIKSPILSDNYSHLIPYKPQKGLHPKQNRPLILPKEKEGNKMADFVIRIPQASVAPPMISRIHAGYSSVQSKPETADPTHTSSHLADRLRSRMGKGAALAPAVQAQMERGFDSDFSGVRVHTDSQAAEMNEALNARAFTHKNDIFFNRGEYDPETTEGKKILIHELVHTIQQGGSPTKGNDANQEGTPSYLTNNTPKVQRIFKGVPILGSVEEKIEDITGYESDFSVEGAITFGRLYGKALSYGVTASPFGLGDSNLFSPTTTFLENLYHGGGSWYDPFLATGEQVLRGFVENTMLWPFNIPGPLSGLGFISARPLLPIEIREAQLVFGDSLDYGRIRIGHNPFFMIDETARTPWETIIFPTDDYLEITFKSITGETSQMPWLIHELMHVWQSQHGYSVITKLGHAMEGESAYKYGDLKKHRLAGKKLRDFNTEQQGDIVQHYYMTLKQNGNTNDYDQYIKEIKES